MQECQKDYRYIIGAVVEKSGRRFSVTREVERRRGRIIEMVKQDFRACGYRVDWKFLDAADYGVPQH